MGKNVRLFTYISCFVATLLACLAGLATAVILGMLYLPYPTVGPTFTTAESLAYDVLYETAGADPNTIRAIQTQQAGGQNELHAVLMGYAVNGEPQIRLILARDNGREFFVENFTPGPTGQNEHLIVWTALHPNNLDSEVAVYGRLLNPTIAHVTITWPSGLELEATVIGDTFLRFQSWSPVDGTAEPAHITAYDAADHIVTEMPLGVP